MSTLHAETVVGRVHGPVAVEDEVVGISETGCIRNHGARGRSKNIARIVAAAVKARTFDVSDQDRRGQRLFRHRAELRVERVGSARTGVATLSDVELAIGPEMD